MDLNELREEPFHDGLVAGTKKTETLRKWRSRQEAIPCVRNPQTMAGAASHDQRFGSLREHAIHTIDHQIRDEGPRALLHGLLPPPDRQPCDDHEHQEEADGGRDDVSRCTGDISGVQRSVESNPVVPSRVGPEVALLQYRAAVLINGDAADGDEAFVAYFERMGARLPGHGLSSAEHVADGRTRSTTTRLAAARRCQGQALESTRFRIWRQQ